MAILVFDFGGTSVKYGLWSGVQIIQEDSFPTPSTWDELKSVITKIKNEFSVENILEGAAFSFPGAVDSSGGVIYGLSAIPYIHNFQIKQELSELLNLPVSLENDANCAALAEAWKGAAHGVENALFVVIGTGVGGAVIYNGKLQTGQHLYGGEFGFMIINDGRTLSELGTAVRMADRYCQRVNVDSSVYSGKDVFELAKKGDQIAIEESEIFFDSIVTGLFNLQLCFDPEVIVIGGGLSANDEVIQTMQSKLNDFMIRRGVSEFEAQLIPCQYRNGANLIGAVKNFLDEHGESSI